MDGFLPNLPTAQTEGRSDLIEQKLLAFIDSLPDEFKQFILAKLEEAETGTMPLPPMDPMMGGAPPMSPMDLMPR